MKRKFTACMVAVFFAPIIAFAQTSPASAGPGSLTVTSTPPGAEVILQGQAEITGVTPTTFRFPLVGEYKMVVRKYGYERFTTRLTVDPTRDMNFDVRLSPKTRAKAALRSLVIPGWGQRYMDHSGKGVLFHFLAASSVAAFLIANSDFNDKFDTYETRQADYQKALDKGASYTELERLQGQVKSANSEARDAEDVRRITIGAVAGVWALNVIDALLFSPEQTGTFNIKGNEVSIAPDPNLQGVKIAFTAHF